jgi:hypothetical protein
VRVVPPPDHLDGDLRGVAQGPEHNAVAPVLGRGALGGVLGQSLQPADWLAIAAVVTANAVALGAGGKARSPAGPGCRVSAVAGDGAAVSAAQVARRSGSDEFRAAPSS